VVGQGVVRAASAAAVADAVPGSCFCHSRLLPYWFPLEGTWYGRDPSPSRLSVELKQVAWRAIARRRREPFLRICSSRLQSLHRHACTGRICDVHAHCFTARVPILGQSTNQDDMQGPLSAPQGPIGVCCQPALEGFGRVDATLHSQQARASVLVSLPPIPDGWGRGHMLLSRFR